MQQLVGLTEISSSSRMQPEFYPCPLGSVCIEHTAKFEELFTGLNVDSLALDKIFVPR